MPGIIVHGFWGGALVLHSVNTFWDALAASTVRARKTFGAWSGEGTRGVAGSRALAGSVQSLMWGGCLPRWCPLYIWLMPGGSLVRYLATRHFFSAF